MTQICDSIELFLPYGMEILHARTVDYFCLLGFWPSGAKTLRGQKLRNIPVDVLLIFSLNTKDFAFWSFFTDSTVIFCYVIER